MKGVLPRCEILCRRHWIFDLDGTLTVAIHDFTSIRRMLGVPDGTDILVHLEGLPEREAVLMKQRLHEIEVELAGRTEAAEGAVRLFQVLSGLGARLGVLTRNTRVSALFTLARIGLGGFVAEEDVLGREEALAKPDPDGILRLAGRWGVLPEETVMVGDYRFDLETGRAAGAGTVHVDHSRAFSWPQLTDWGVGNLAELALALEEDHPSCSSSLSTIWTSSE